METNVRLPPCAFAALDRVAARWGTSRDATARRLLSEHVQAQEDRAPDDRLTHISTVLRYPPLGKRAPAPRTARPLRLRAQPDLLERARAVSLRLPGQYARGHRDYQARTLTDAVMTAIATAEPIVDDFLEGLLPLLRQRAALGLWRLATAATATGPEREALNAARKAAEDGWPLEVSAEDFDGPDDEVPARMRRVQLVARILEEDVAWHAPGRFEVAANLARSSLTGPGAEDVEILLYEQAEDWQELYQDTLHADRERKKQLLAGTFEYYDFTGRGGTAVWRAERRVEQQDFETWLTSQPTGTAAARLITPPGWMLRKPESWHAHMPDHPAGEGDLPQPYEQWVAQGKVLCFPSQGRRVFWPLTPHPKAPGWTPVPGIEPVIAAAGHLRPDQLSAFIEAVFIDWAHEFEDDVSGQITLRLPVDRAVEFGLLTLEDQHAHMAAARTQTLQLMDAIIEEFRQDDPLDVDRIEQLCKARGRSQEFGRLAREYDARIGSKFRTVRPSWPWPGGSVAHTLLSGSSPRLLQCLAHWAHRNSIRILEESMENAWNRAFDRYGRQV
ncbi:hypothetical protein ACF1AO_34285 [Streptomyces longwoodensis]|uniref:hypothetical protein n=1 Tax=Streptomyces longwoodensis TaxID=68231 RepID=UPI003700B438